MWGHVFVNSHCYVHMSSCIQSSLVQSALASCQLQAMRLIPDALHDYF